MKYVFGHLAFVIIYIDDILICSQYINQHNNHLDYFYDVVCENGLALPKNKMVIGKTKIEFLGIIPPQGKVELHEHVLKSLGKFPTRILFKTQLERFLGCLNCIW